MYTTIGSVRGGCGHQHRTLAAANKCLSRDGQGCADQGGYTDRHIVRADGSPLSDAEEQELMLEEE